MARREHRGLLQRDIDALRHPGGVLHGGIVPDDVRGAQVRVQVGGRGQGEEAHRVQRAAVRGLPTHVGGVAGG